MTETLQYVMAKHIAEARDPVYKCPDVTPYDLDLALAALNGVIEYLKYQREI